MPFYSISPRAAAQSPSAFRRELRENKRRAREAAILEFYARYVGEAFNQIYGRRASVAYDAISAAISVWLPQFLSLNASRETVAAHECGHFVAYEHEGMCAGTAHIKGSAFDRYGWGGGAQYWGDPLYLEPGRWEHDPEDFCRFARVTLAGPIAEEIIGGGDAMANIGELMNARVYSDRAADLIGELHGVVWTENVRKTVAMVERCQFQIVKLAEMLAKRKEITRDSPSVRKVLKIIKPGALITDDELAVKNDALARRIIGETPCVAGFGTTESAE